MKVEKRNITIEKEEYFFVAEDGTEFSEEWECKKYEIKVKQDEMKDVLAKEYLPYDVVQPSVYYEDVNGFYYVENENEIQDLWKYFELKDGKNPAKYSKCFYDGEGWYVYTEVDNDCSGSYQHYELIKVDFKAWREWLEQFDWMKDVVE